MARRWIPSVSQGRSSQSFEAVRMAREAISEDFRDSTVDACSVRWRCGGKALGLFDYGGQTRRFNGADQ